MPDELPTAAQREAIARTTALFQAQPGVRALLLAGSLAHGFGTEASDVDVMIVVSDAEWAARAAEGRTTFFDFMQDTELDWLHGVTAVDAI
jgi:predicted nucleotidyltransferase